MTDRDELREVARQAAEGAAERVASKTPTMEQIERIVDQTATRAAREAAADAAKTAVAQTLIGFGLDPNNRAEILKDMLFLSEMRSLSASSKRHVVLAILGILATGVATAVWAYLKAEGKVP